ncbi:MAG: hypothetical protein MJB57_03230 [Gemmatimonadetes bacterium]|nr:hypothetical protein [Gemmatimonadota bacterium]
MRRWARGALLAGALGGLAVPGGFAQTDTILVRLTDEGAEVHQRLEPEGGTVSAFAIRIDGQTLAVDEVVREGVELLDAALSPTSDAYAFEVASGAPIRIVYTVTGASERVPLFVAGGRAELTVVEGVYEPYLLRVEGSGARLSELELASSLPRLRSVSASALEVRLSSVPSLVGLPGGGAFSFTRAADAFALFVIMAGALWAFRRGRVTKAAP